MARPAPPAASGARSHGVELTLVQKLTSKEAGFGSSVALSGGRLLVSGAGVQVYERKRESWRFSGTLAEPDVTREFTLFGSELALAGDSLLVGAPHAAGASGKAYVFDGSVESGPTALAGRLSWQAAGLEAHPEAFLARSVAMTSRFAALGARSALLVFEKEGRSWQFYQRPLPASFIAGDRFGYQVRMDERSLLVSDPWKDGSGCAYVFELDAARKWVERATLRSPGATLFGSRVAISGTIAAVTATDSARRFVSVFRRDDSGAWARVAELEPPDARPRWFGSDLAIVGDLVVIAAGGRSGDETGSAAPLDPGAAHVYQRTGDGSYAHRATLRGAGLPEEFARSVSASGSHIVIGAPAHVATEGGLPVLSDQAGSVYVYALQRESPDGVR